MNVTVDITLEQADDGTPCWSADSPDVPGWFAAAQSLQELRGLVHEGVAVALGRDDFTIVERLAPA